MNNNLIILLRAQRQTMPIVEGEIYIPLTRLKPYNSERSYAILYIFKKRCVHYYYKASIESTMILSVY